MQHILLKKISHVPLPEKVNHIKYNVSLAKYISLFILGHCLWILIGILFMSYLRGIQIR